MNSNSETPAVTHAYITSIYDFFIVTVFKDRTIVFINNNKYT